MAAMPRLWTTTARSSRVKQKACSVRGSDSLGLGLVFGLPPCLPEYEAAGLTSSYSGPRFLAQFADIHQRIQTNPLHDTMIPKTVVRPLSQGHQIPGFESLASNIHIRRPGGLLLALRSHGMDESCDTGRPPRENAPARSAGWLWG